MLVNADLHIHSPFSMAVSRNMHRKNFFLPVRLRAFTFSEPVMLCTRSGKRNRKLFMANAQKVCVIPSSEIEDDHRVHHLILAEDFGQFDRLRDLLAPKSLSIGTNGRPHVYLRRNDRTTDP